MSYLCATPILIACSLLGCAGRSEATEIAPCPVRLANPPPASGCFRAIAGEGSAVRVIGDTGPGETWVDVHASDAGYEALACSETWGAPTLGPCDEVE
jgi:hypothetical protein